MKCISNSASGQPGGGANHNKDMTGIDQFNAEGFISDECGDSLWNEENLKGALREPQQRRPLPPFTLETALEKVQLAENAWNTKDPYLVSLAYTPDTDWRNRSEFVKGREQVQQFLTKKWQKELGYRLKKELWSYSGNRIAVRFEYESHDAAGQWYRSYGIELWEFDENGLMARRVASINDEPIEEAARRLF